MGLRLISNLRFCFRSLSAEIIGKHHHAQPTSAYSEIFPTLSLKNTLKISLLNHPVVLSQLPLIARLRSVLVDLICSHVVGQGVHD